MTTDTNKNLNKFSKSALSLSHTHTYLGQVVYQQHCHVDLTFGNPRMLENYKATSGLHSSSEY